MSNRPPFSMTLTFDDVLLVPQKSSVLPRDVWLSTRLTRKIQLNVPVISAAMDTVTESAMAIALARAGGLGVIHKNLSIDEQSAMVDRVKRSESGMIINPVTVDAGSNIGEAKKIMAQFKISGLPVVDKGKLAGIITNRDIRFHADDSLSVSSQMTSKNLITVPTGTSLEKAKKILQKHRIEKLLVVDGTGNLSGLITVKDIQKKEDFPYACKDGKGRLRVGAAIGVTIDSMDRADALVDADVDAIFIDTAHGHSKGVISLVENMKAKFSGTAVVAGNVATSAGTKALIDAGADCIKIGIGAGASCTTRVIAGVGVPQLTAIMDGVDAAQDADIPIIADGGLRYSGDIAKALAAGADSVMLGSLLGGMEESPGEFILYEGRQYKSYRGMGSMSAMQSGSGDRYFQEGAEATKLVPEGIEGIIPFRGSVKNTIHQLLGGVRAAMGYCGCRTILEFRQQANFIRVSNAGVKENHPHEVRIVKEAPNYQVPEK